MSGPPCLERGTGEAVQCAGEQDYGPACKGFRNTAEKDSKGRYDEENSLRLKKFLTNRTKKTFLI